MTNLTYTINDGTNYNDTHKTQGKVNVTDLSCYHMQYNGKGCPSQVTIQTVAHAYGEMNLAAEPRLYNDIKEVLDSKCDYQYYWRQTRHQQQLAYRFREYNPDDTRKVYPYLTDRYITAESVDYVTYDVTHANGKDPQTFAYLSKDKTVNGTIAIPQEYLGNEGTTYIYRGFHDPTAAPIYKCGDRCIKM